MPSQYNDADLRTRRLTRRRAVNEAITDCEKEKDRGLIDAYCREVNFRWGTYEQILPQKYRPMFCETVLERTSELEIRQWHDIMRHSMTEGKSLSSLWEKGGWLFEEVNHPQIRSFNNGKAVFCNTVLRRVITKYKIPRNASGGEDESGDVATKSEIPSEDVDAEKTSNMHKRKAESDAPQQGPSASNKQPRLGEGAHGGEQSLTEQMMQQTLASSEARKRLDEAKSKVSGHQENIRRRQRHVDRKQHEINDRRNEIERLQEEVQQLQENIEEDKAKVASYEAETAKSEEECRLHGNLLQALRELDEYQSKNTRP